MFARLSIERRHDLEWKSHSFCAFENFQERTLGGCRRAGCRIGIHKHAVQIGDEIRNLVGFARADLAEEREVEWRLESGRSQQCEHGLVRLRGSLDALTLVAALRID